MLFPITFIIIALAGIINAGYLTYKHQKKEVLICPFNQDCNAVTESKWANIFSVRNEILGLLFYVFGIVAVLILLAFPEFSFTIYLLLLIASSAALLFSIFLIFIQVFVLKNYCFYCLVSAALNLLLFINILISWAYRG